MRIVDLLLQRTILIMHLKNDSGETLDLSIIGYQFPGLEEDNWLMVSVDVKLQTGGWSATEPSLETIDLEELIDWFKSIKSNVATKPLLVFTEPNLQFEVVENNARNLRVYFELESRPTWVPRGDGEMHDLWFEIGLTPDNLDYMIASLQQELTRFPTRAIEE